MANGIEKVPGLNKISYSQYLPYTSYMFDHMTNIYILWLKFRTCTDEIINYISTRLDIISIDSSMAADENVLFFI